VDFLSKSELYKSNADYDKNMIEHIIFYNIKKLIDVKLEIKIKNERKIKISYKFLLNCC
jgi:hypothetical protein